MLLEAQAAPLSLSFCRIPCARYRVPICKPSTAGTWGPGARGRQQQLSVSVGDAGTMSELCSFGAKRLVLTLSRWCRMGLDVRSGICTCQTHFPCRKSQSSSIFIKLGETFSLKGRRSENCFIIMSFQLFTDIWWNHINRNYIGGEHV